MRDAPLLPVAWWPAAPVPCADGIYVIAVRTDGERETARRLVRDALCGAIGQLYGLAAGDVVIHHSPGLPPSVSFSRPAGAPTPGISISHDGGLSLAAINRNGPVGVDVMQVHDIEDWRGVARDYLGPEALAALDAAPPGQRPAALARAWTEHEARFKCHGRQLAEWDGTSVPVRSWALDLPAPFVGAVAILPSRR